MYSKPLGPLACLKCCAVSVRFKDDDNNSNNRNQSCKPESTRVFSHTSGNVVIFFILAYDSVEVSCDL